MRSGLTRRVLLWSFTAALCAAAPGRADEPAVKRVAGVVTVYRPNSHADVILGRILQTDTLDGRGRQPRLQLVSLYVDQFPDGDLARPLSAQHGFPIYDSIAGALTLGTDRLAVDGVIIVAEHGKYPESPTGQIVWPKRRFFSEVAAVFERSGRVAPVFSDKHLADNAADAVWFYETARRLRVPLMAGSSITATWRKPALDVERDAPLTELVVIAYGPLDAYGFHGMDLLQALAERRQGGETGVASVRCLTGAAVWHAGRDGLYDRRLLDHALRQQRRPLREGQTVEDLVREPAVFLITYRDGLRASLFVLNGAAVDWSAAWKVGREGTPSGLVIDAQDNRPFMHFAHLLQGVEQMLHTGAAAWPVERTLYSSVMLHAGLRSKVDGGGEIATPELTLPYRSRADWKQPSDAGR